MRERGEHDDAVPLASPQPDLNERDRRREEGNGEILHPAPGVRAIIEDAGRLDGERLARWSPAVPQFSLLPPRRRS